MSDTQDWSATRFLWSGLFTLAVLIFGLGAWSVFTSIAGAIVASGVVEVASTRQIVQHGEGGVVAEILVTDGDTVAAGEVLIRLDGTLLRSELAIVEGQLFEVLARLDRLRAERNEADSITIGADLLNRREEAITTLLELQYNAVELRERRLSLSERINRLEIKAPRAGVIYGLQIKTLRAVITAAEPILYVVPADSFLVIRTRINAIDIDQLALKQPATLRFSAFDTRTTPELDGYVTNISADISTDETTGATFYTAELLPMEGEVEKLKTIKSSPACPSKS